MKQSKDNTNKSETCTRHKQTNTK